MQIEFIFPRPKSHYRTGKFSHILKEDAPSLHICTPDLDNLIKFSLDALNKVFYKDDSLVVEVNALKRYIEDGEEGKTEIYIQYV